MKEGLKKNVELTPPPVFTPAPVVTPKPQIDTYSYTLGFTKGYKEGDSMIVGWAFGGCAVLTIVIAFMMLWNHISHLTNVLFRLQTGVLDALKKEKEQASEGKKGISAMLLPLILTVCLAGCAGKQSAGEPVPPVPVPPQTAQAPEKAQAPKKADAANPKPDSRNDAGKMSPYDASYGEDETTQYLAVDIPADLAADPHKGEPGELAELLELKGGSSKGNSAVRLMRPAAIREAAQLVTFQTAIAWRYKQLVAATESHGAIMDTAFDFSPLVMMQGDALIMPPLLTRAGASMRIEQPETATAAETTYELLEPARYIATVPNWREFLMIDGFPEPEKPNPAVLPKNDEERAIWRAAVREAWAQGLAEADQLYADNVARMVRNYRGVMLYHLLTAQHLLSRVDTASADLGMHTSDNGNKLNISQKVYRITAPSVFTAKDAELHYAVPPKAANSKKNGR